MDVSQQPTPVVLMLVLRAGTTGPEILLGRKLTGFGAGNIVAPGGKVEAEESDVQAAVRELAEETSLRAIAENCDLRATVMFRFPANPDLDMNCQVFLTRNYSGVAENSRELEVAWYPTENLPVDRMWQDAQIWLPQILAGERFTATVIMSDDNLAVASLTTKTWE